MGAARPSLLILGASQQERHSISDQQLCNLLRVHEISVKKRLEAVIRRLRFRESTGGALREQKKYKG